MSRFLVLIVIVIAAAAVLPAAQVACPVNTTFNVLQAYTNLDSACFSQDKLFYNFIYTPTAGGIAGPATGVSADLISQVGVGLDIHGWNFSSNNWVQGASPAGFTLSFTIQVCPTGSACVGAVIPGMKIVGADAVYAPVSTFTAGNEVVNWSNGATATLTSASPGPKPSDGNIGYSAVGPISVSAVWAGTGGITQNTFRFYESTVPEPMSFVLIGTGLLGLGLLRRRVRKN